MGNVTRVIVFENQFKCNWLFQNIDPNLRSLGKESVFVRSESTNSSQDIETVRLAARSVHCYVLLAIILNILFENFTNNIGLFTQLLLHLLTQIGHFPMSNGAARCGSIVSENDDLPGLTSELDELNSYVFSLPNLQVISDFI